MVKRILRYECRDNNVVMDYSIKCKKEKVKAKG
jgi:hypothetical protein